MNIFNNLVDDMFSSLAFSAETEKAKLRLSEILNLKYEELLLQGETKYQAVGLIIYRYGNLEKASKLIGTDLRDFTSESDGKNVFTAQKFKKINVRLRFDTIFIAFGFSVIFAAAAKISYLDLTRFLIIAIPSLIISAFGIFSMMTYREIRFGKSIIPKDALESVRIKLGIFQQRYIGSIIILMGTTVYGAVSVVKNFYSASVNLENILSMSDLWILSFGVFICIKNGIRVARCSSFLSPNSSNDYKKYKITIIFSSVIFWAIALIIAVLLDLFTSLSAYVSNFLIATACVYTAFFLLFNQINGKNHFAEKIKLSKKRVISASVAILLICAVQVMNSASWWIQPYVSMIPSVMHPTSKISYDSTTGVYSITKNSTDFKVLQLTDIHLGGSAFSTEKDLLALKAVYTLIQRTVPDLVIVTGDLVFPVGISSFSLNNYTPIMQFALFMRNIGIPWAFTYGNHDTEFVATHNDKQLNSLFETFSYEKTQNLLYSSVQPKISGRNNQLIKILNPDGSINQALFLLDSNSYAGGKINNYDYIHDDQVNWYADCVSDMSTQSKKTVSSLMFCHIPLREYRDAYNLYINKSDEVKYFFGKIGEENNSICCSQYQSKIFDKITELKSTKGIFVGHDHYNNISLEYKGVRLTYGMSIDYLVMPEIDKKTEQRGGTLITLHSDSSFDISQVRLSDLK